MRFRAQGAIELSCGSTARTCRGQGATEYLVLLAVVLIIGLVGIALLGFFPGTVSEAQISESQLYWRSASPIAIIETGAKSQYSQPTRPFVYLRLRNAGPYQIQITKLVGGSGGDASRVYEGSEPGTLMSAASYLRLSPGEETYLGASNVFSVPYQRLIYFHQDGTSGGGYSLAAASPICTPTMPNGTAMVVRNFGFEYIQYVEGQQLTKSQIGAKELIIRCTGSA